MCFVKSVCWVIVLLLLQGGTSVGKAAEGLEQELVLVVGIISGGGKRQKNQGLQEGGRERGGDRNSSEAIRALTKAEGFSLVKGLTGIVRDQTRHQKLGFPSQLELLTGSEPKDQFLY